MIERINLIEKEAFQFSYTKLVQAVVGVIVLCVLIYGGQIFRSVFYEKKIQALRDEQTNLLSQQKIIAKATPATITEGSNAELQKVFLDTPKWSELLQDLSGRLPPTVWFTGLKASTARTELPKSGSSKANAPKGAPPPESSGGKNSIVLTGIASSVGDLAIFVASLQQSPFIAKATLTNSREEEARFTFEVVCDMIVPRQ